LSIPDEESESILESLQGMPGIPLDYSKIIQKYTEWEQYWNAIRPKRSGNDLYWLEVSWPPMKIVRALSRKYPTVKFQFYYDNGSSTHSISLLNCKELEQVLKGKELEKLKSLWQEYRLEIAIDTLSCRVVKVLPKENREDEIRLTNQGNTIWRWFREMFECRKGDLLFFDSVDSGEKTRIVFSQDTVTFRKEEFTSRYSYTKGAVMVFTKVVFTEKEGITSFRLFRNQLGAYRVGTICGNGLMEMLVYGQTV